MLSESSPALLKPPAFFKPGCSVRKQDSTPERGSAEANGLRERACFYGDQLISPSAAIHALFSASFSDWRNSPRMLHPDGDDVMKRFSVFYERKAARSAGEFLAGYLHHEEFRPRTSGKIGILERSRAALLGVVVSGCNSGDLRPMFSPIAGAFSSGFVEAAAFPSHGLWQEGLLRSGAVYGGYFGSALFREFKPELVSAANKLLRRTK